ncbi:MAG: PD-(D/E)XK nuclease family protein [Gaiella sp.]
MGLSLVTGPAHAGKIAALLDRFVGLLDRDPWLIVPGRPDVEWIERELLHRRGALLTGSIGTFDTLFEHLAGSDARRVIGEVERAVLVRRAVASVELDATSASSRFGGFAQTLAATLSELDGALVDPATLSGDLAVLQMAYRAELERAGAWDRAGQRRHALERLSSELGAWDGRPVLAYGFEDLTGAEWRLLEILAARTDVHVSLPYEPGRTVFASLERTVADLAAHAGAAVVELPARASEHLPAPLAHLERELFGDAVSVGGLDGSVRFLEGAGRRATLELVADEILELVATGVEPHEIAVVCPSTEHLARSIESAFGALGVPVAIERRASLGSTTFGAALVALLRFSWLGGTRHDLFGFLRSTFGGLARSEADWLEGRLRGRAVTRADRVLEELGNLRGHRPLPAFGAVANAAEPLAAIRVAAAIMLRSAHGTMRPRPGEALRADLRAYDAAIRVLAELELAAAAGVELSRDEIVAALERGDVRAEGAGARGRVAVLDLSRVRTRRFDVVFVLGLEQGTLPRRARPSPFLDDGARRALDERGARIERPDASSRDRYLFYTACTRPRRGLVLVREATTDDGVRREPSPFWEAVVGLYDPDDVRLMTTRRSLASLTWQLERAPTDRERLRSLAALAAVDRDDAFDLARANGWERRLERACRAFTRPTAVTHPRALQLLASRETFRVTDLERMAGCSSAWLVERHLRPGQIDQSVDARMRGSIAHVALQRFYSQLPSAIPGADRVTSENLEDAVRLMRECVSSALASGVRIDVSPLRRRELEHSLQRDLEQLVLDEAVRASPFVPRRLEVSFPSYELADGVLVSGKIDRVDADPLSARGVVADYKSGSAPSAVQIREEARLQIPLYLLVLRDQLGLEPMGGLYVPLGGGRKPRGLLLGGDERVPGYAAADYLDPDAFAAEIDHARDHAIELVGRIREGDIRHDPRGGQCPAWCDLWRMCRIERP